MANDRFSRRALAILKSNTRKQFQFQASLASESLKACEARERILVVAPTGCGKTLISQLIVALFAETLSARFPRVLVVVPTRGLVEQHFEDAAWLRRQSGIALHCLYSDTPLDRIKAMLESSGLIITTPVTIAHRLSLIPEPLDVLASIDFAVFDEIDTYLTSDELAERRDYFPSLQNCVDASVPVVGFTGTNLNSDQLSAWKRLGFRVVHAAVPRDWLPSTDVHFVGVQDLEVEHSDAQIRNDLGLAFHLLVDDGHSPDWVNVKKLARGGYAHAIRILSLCAERLALFESLGTSDQKLDPILDEAAAGPMLVLTRFRRSAEEVALKLNANGVETAFAHGGLQRIDIARQLQSFRDTSPGVQRSLVLTRELGGRGLDFPNAASVCLISPRNNYQAVAQELARIRSRKESPKPAKVVYYSNTEEEAKAERLGRNLSSQRFGEEALFTVSGVPRSTYNPKGIEGRIMFLEESVSGF